MINQTVASHANLNRYSMDSPALFIIFQNDQLSTYLYIHYIYLIL